MRRKKWDNRSARLRAQPVSQFWSEPLEGRVLFSANVLANHNGAGSTGEDQSESLLTPADIASTQASSSVSTNFGRLFDTTLDGQIYAQPLAVANVNITRGLSQGIHNVLYVATMHDSLYAVDANTGAILWQDTFLNIADPTNLTATSGVTTVPSKALVVSLVGPELGILSTPTIDASTNTLYLLANSQELRNGATPVPSFTSGMTDFHYVARLWAVDLSSGSVAIAPGRNPPSTIEPSSGGAIVADTILDPTGNNTSPTFGNFTGYEYVAGPFVRGTGNNNDTFNSDGTVASTSNTDGWGLNAGEASSPWGAVSMRPADLGYIAFNALLQMNRVAVTLINGDIYLGFASHSDTGPYYGWLLGYSASNLENNSAFVVTPTFNGAKGGASIWGPGATITTDGTYLYFTVGNGAFNPAMSNFNADYYSIDGANHVLNPLNGDYGESVLKVEVDANATQANINLDNDLTGNPTPNGAYDPGSGYDENGYGLKVVDFFTPSNVYELNLADEDIGSSGVLLIPSTGPGSATAPNGDPMLVLAGKEGRIYLLDADNLGGFNTQYIVDGHEMADGLGNTSDPSGDPAPYDRVLGEYYYAEALNHNIIANNTEFGGFCSPSYFHGVFYVSLSNTTSATAPELGFNVATFPFSPTISPRTGDEPTPSFTSGGRVVGTGLTATISSNGLSNGIIWILDGEGSAFTELDAFDTSGNLLFSSGWKISGAASNSSDTLENGVSGSTGIKFALPTVFNGMVYAGTGGTVGGSGLKPIGTITGYGLLSSQLTSSTFGAPTDLMANAATTTDNHLIWTRNSTLESGLEIDRSTDAENWSVLQYVSSGASSYDDMVASGSTFFYRVRAINGASATAFSYALIINGGTYNFSDDPQVNTPNLNVVDNGALTFAAAMSGSGINVRHLGMLTIGAGAAVSLATAAAPADRLVLVARALNISDTFNNWIGSIDLGANDMVVVGDSFTEITNQIASGLNSTGGYWNGTGIRSSIAASDTRYLTTLGAMQSPGGLFDGVNTTISDVLTKYTYYGDADLNGVVDGADYHQIDLGFGNHLTGWANGDFNYDGAIDGSDYALIDNAFNQLAATSAGPLARVASQQAQIASAFATSPGQDDGRLDKHKIEPLVDAVMDELSV